MHKDIIVNGIPAYHTYPRDNAKHPGLIVIHEIWGLVDHVKDVADRFAQQGYSVIAPDLFYGMGFEGKIDQSILDEMHNPEKRDEAQKKMRAILAPIQAPEFAEKTIANLEACVDYLVADEHGNGKIAVLGFCFGGTYSFALAASDTRVKAAVPFYGQPLQSEKIKNLQCPALAFYGDQDTGLMQTLPDFKKLMQKNKKDFTAVVYPNIGHAFFNNTNARMYNQPAAQDAWEKTLVFLKKNLG